MAKIRLADHADMLNRAENYENFSEGVDVSKKRSWPNGRWRPDETAGMQYNARQCDCSSRELAYWLGRLYGLGYFDEEINSWNSTKPTAMPAR